MIIKRMLTLIWAALVPLAAVADTVTLKDGSVLNGTVTGISGGVLTLQTTFAGTLNIQQDQIVSFTTGQPLALRTVDDNVVRGTVSGSSGSLSVSSAEGTFSTSVDRVKTAWAADAEDPQIVARRPVWRYRADFDLSGRQGNSRRLSTGAGIEATRSTPENSLHLYSRVNYSTQDGSRSEDAFRAGSEFSTFFTPRMSWFTNVEGGYDRIRDLDLRLRAALGLGYAVIRKPEQTLNFRGGLSYRFEDYGAVIVDDVDSIGLEIGLIHTYNFKRFGALNQSLTFTPAFEDFGNYLLVHDSSLTLPGGDWWNLRLGIRNEFTSETPVGLKKLDTLFYARIGIIWR